MILSKEDVLGARASRPQIQDDDLLSNTRYVFCARDARAPRIAGVRNGRPNARHAEVSSLHSVISQAKILLSNLDKRSERVRVLFIGGTGNISTACSRLAIERGIDLFVLNRGHQADLPLDAGHFLRGDIRDRKSAGQALRLLEFDAVVDWVAFEVNHVETDIDLFRQRTQQYVFISSASTYQKPPAHYRITESTPLANPFWQYSRDKIACEERLNKERRSAGFPVTIVRPSYTYGETWIPCVVAGHGYTVIDRMRKGKKVIVHGDGQSLWTMTHNSDFAKGLVGILGNDAAIGESVHITSDEVLTWDQVFEAIGAAAGARPRIVHVPSEWINAFDPETGAGLLGDKAYSMVFDNTKIKRLVPGFEATVPFAEGIRRSVAWFDADESRRTIDKNRDRMMDRIIEEFQAAWPKQEAEMRGEKSG